MPKRCLGGEYHGECWAPSGIVFLTKWNKSRCLKVINVKIQYSLVTSFKTNWCFTWNNTAWAIRILMSLIWKIYFTTYDITLQVKSTNFHQFFLRKSGQGGLSFAGSFSLRSFINPSVWSKRILFHGSQTLSRC